MSQLRPAGYDYTNQFRQLCQGDTVIGGESVKVVLNSNTTPLTADQVTGGILQINAGTTLTLPDPNSVINSLAPIQSALQNNRTGLSSGAGVLPGSTFRLKVINITGGSINIFAGTIGFTWDAGSYTQLAILNGTTAEYLATVFNGTPQQIVVGNATNGNTKVTGLSDFQTSQLTVGMILSGTGITAGTTIVSIQPGIGFTLSSNFTGTTGFASITCGPNINMQRIG